MGWGKHVVREGASVSVLRVHRCAPAGRRPSLGSQRVYRSFQCDEVVSDLGLC